MNIIIISNYKDEKNGKSTINKYLDSLINGFLDLNYEVYFGGGEPDKVYTDPLIEKINISKIKFDNIEDYSIYDYILTDITRFNYDNALHKNRWINLNNKITKNNLTDRHCLLHFSDCSNRGYFSDDIFQHFKCRTIVKRETSIQEFPDVLPLDMAIKQYWKQNLNKDIFVSCLFGTNSGSKTKGSHRLQIAQSIKNNFSTSPVCLGLDNLGNRTFSSDKYFNILNRSKISISCWGAGYSCYRDWEILSCDTVLAYKRMPNPHLDNYIDMESCIEYDTPQELIKKLKYFENNLKELEEVRLKSIKVTNQYNLPKHRAQKLINAIDTGIPTPSWVNKYN